MLAAQINRIEDKLGGIMATISEVQADFKNYQSDVTSALQALSSQVADLQAQVASGGTVEASDLDSLKASIDAADATLKPPSQVPPTT